MNYCKIHQAAMGKWLQHITQEVHKLDVFKSSSGISGCSWLSRLLLLTVQDVSNFDKLYNFPTSIIINVCLCAISRLLALKKAYCTDFLVDELTLNTTDNHGTFGGHYISAPWRSSPNSIFQTSFYNKYRNSPNISKTDTSMYYRWAYTIYLIRIWD